jgi:alginate O-acetyltransferase complex protein AlgI
MGFATGPLFRAPLTARLIYIPLRRGGRGGTAIFLAFLFSGILHELAIRLPVRAAFGLPTLNLLLPGALVAADRRGLRLGRAGTLLALALPLPLCFHPPFVTGVLWPIIGILPA